jgi:hypothetical protein
MFLKRELIIFDWSQNEFKFKSGEQNPTGSLHTSEMVGWTDSKKRQMNGK